MLARISHQFPTAAVDKPMSTASRSKKVLNIAPAMPPRFFLRVPCTPLPGSGRGGAAGAITMAGTPEYIHGLLRRLVTEIGEKCGLRRIFAACAACVLSCFFCAPVFAQNLSRDDLEALTLKGQEMIFARRYDDAAKIFGDLKRDFPGSPAGWFGLMAVLEMRMFEREDFHLEKEFLRESREGRTKAAAALAIQRPEKMDLFMAGSLFGLDGFFNARKGNWWEAYVQGTKSRQIFRHVKEMDPSFVDADFGLGMYIYWRSVFAKDLWFLKMFPDRRAEGVSIVSEVARSGKFAKELARINLGIMHFEDGRYGEAEGIFSSYAARFPNNVIIRNFLGRVLLAEKKYDQAAGQFREILKIDPLLKKPHYFLGVALVLKNNPEEFAEAEGELKSFLSKESGKYWPSYAYYWLGKLAEARDDKTAALAAYEAAHRLNPKLSAAEKRVRAMGGAL